MKKDAAAETQRDILDRKLTELTLRQEALSGSQGRSKYRSV